jgi:taurine dioxygenase
MTTTAAKTLRNREYEHIDVSPVAGSMGAEISGVDLLALDEAAFREVEAALLAYKVIFFRDQSFDAGSQSAFGRRFGALNRHPYVKGLDGHPDVFHIVKEPDDVHHFGSAWHTDLAYTERPALGTILYGMEVPDAGGDTLFANLEAAYEALSDGMKALLDRRKIVFTNANTYGKDSQRFKIGVAKAMSVEPATEEREVVHPAVRTHPVTGAKGLYLSTTHASRLADMTVEESRPILDFLHAHAVRPEFTCRFRWQNGSVAMWDNRCTMHHAVNDFPGERRIMQRVTLEGDRPV